MSGGRARSQTRRLAPSVHEKGKGEQGRRNLVSTPRTRPICGQKVRWSPASV